MNNLLEELNKYQALTSTRDNLNSELLNLSGKNDQESIKRINEIGANLNQISKSLQNYDKEKLDKVTKYYETKKEFDRLVGELQTIEKLSKKSNGEKTETLSSEGIKKYIDKSEIVFVNGTCGKFEDERFMEGTSNLFKILKDSGKKVIVGGGDTASACIKFGFKDSFDFISSGGGATLEYIADGTLKALEWME